MQNCQKLSFDFTRKSTFGMSDRKVSKLEHLQMPVQSELLPASRQQTNNKQTTNKQVPKYIASPDLINHLLDWETHSSHNISNLDSYMVLLIKQACCKGCRCKSFSMQIYQLSKSTYLVKLL